MFETFVLACALANGEIDPTRCLKIEDQLGPYKIEQECKDRVNFLIDVFSDPLLMQYFYVNLDYPETIKFVGFCEQEGELT